MSSLSTTSKIALISTSVIAAATVSYAIYFDNKRRSNPVFRKKLLKEHRKYAKKAQAQADGGRQEAQDALRRALLLIATEAVPQDVQAKEAYFMEHVGFGEQLAARSPEHYVASAVSFYRALRVYPAPTELITIYQKTQPPQVFEYVMALVAMDIGAATSGQAARPQDPRDVQSDAILTEIEPDAASGNGSSDNGSSPPSTGSFVHVDPTQSTSAGDDPPEAAL